MIPGLSFEVHGGRIAPESWLIGAREGESMNPEPWRCRSDSWDAADTELVTVLSAGIELTGERLESDG